MIAYKICNEHSRRIVIGITIFTLLLSGVEVIRAEVGLPDLLQVPGRLEANGTLFEMNNNEYINITLNSSEPINLILESIPEMVTMNVDSINGASSTIITMSGFLPNTTYHKYEDNYHDHKTFITDVNGNHTYEQDLSIEHLVFIQPKSGTKFINDNATGGDCSSIGIWDPSEKTCTLTTDLAETIQIDSDGIILDGNGHLVTGSKTGRGVYFTDRKYVTIKNLNVTQFSVGLEMYNSSFSNIKENNAFNNIYDFRIIYSNDNEIINSAASVSDDWGIQLYASNNNIISGNTIIGTKRGIWLYSSNNNILSNNTVPNNWYGSDCIRLASSNNNKVIDNIITPILNNLDMKGIRLMYSNNNVVSGNKVSNNLIGILVESSDNNTIYNNYLNNTNNAITTGNNTWNTTKTVGTNIIGGPYLGGNYWSDYAGVDRDGDGLGNTLLPYHGWDYLPLTEVNIAPVSDPNGPYAGMVGVAIPFNGSGSHDPDGIIASYAWDFGDGNTAAGASPTHIYAKNGIYTVTLTVTDNKDATDTNTTTATIARAMVISCDGIGAEKNIFALDEDVYCYTGDIPPNTAVKIYVVDTKDDWKTGDSLIDVSGGEETVTTNSSGGIWPPVNIWSSPLVAGKYDIVVDTDNYGFLDEGEPIDSWTTTGFEAVPEFTTIAIPVAIVLGLVFLISRRKRKRVSGYMRMTKFSLAHQ